MSYSIDSKLGDLLDNDATKAMLEKHLPGISTHPQIAMGRGLALTEAGQAAYWRAEEIFQIGQRIPGEVADAAVLCPSFYRADVIRNASRWDRAKARLRRAVIGFLQRRRERGRLLFERTA